MTRSSKGCDVARRIHSDAMKLLEASMHIRPISRALAQEPRELSAEELELVAGGRVTSRLYPDGTIVTKADPPLPEG